MTGSSISKGILGVMLIVAAGFTALAQPEECNPKGSCLEVQSGRICDLADYCSTLTGGPGYTAECVEYGIPRMNALGYYMDRFFIRYTPTVKTHSEVLVAVHGGGYSCGKACNRDFKDMAEYWAQNGREVILVEYRRGFVPGICICGCPDDKTDYCSVPLAQLQHAENLANKDLQDAIEYFHTNYPAAGGGKQPLVLFGNSAGASMIYNAVLTHATWAHDNNVVGAIPKSGLLPAARNIINHSIPLYIVHHDCDDLVPYYQYFPYKNLVGCDNFPLTYGGRHMWDVYTSIRGSRNAGPDDGRAFMKTICGGGHGDANGDSPTTHTQEGFQYFAQLAAHGNTEGHFWASNHILYQQKDIIADHYDDPAAGGCNLDPNCCSTGNCVTLREASPELPGGPIGFGPNPVSPGAVIGIKGIPSGSTVHIFDAHGRKKGEKLYDGVVLKLCDFDLGGGLHIMQLQQPDGTVTNHKMIVKD